MTLNDLAASARRQNQTILNNIGICVSVTDIFGFDEYAAARDELAAMNPVRRWLSFRLRRKQKRRWLLMQQGMINEIIKKAS